MTPHSSSSGSPSFPFSNAQSAASADEPESSLPLGQRLVRAGLISQSQLAQALREQQQNHLKLGEVCLERGWLQLSDLYRFIPSQALSLGEILVALGYLDFEQLRVALAQQRRYGRKLGEILTWKGWVEQAALDHALDVQVQLQQLASPNAWEALQPFLAVHPKPGSEATLQTSAEEMDPSQIIQKEPDPSSSSTPTSASVPEVFAQPVTLADYRKQVEALKLQIQLQEQEWDRILADMNQQIADFQSQYQQRIQKLEATIRLQQAELRQQTTLQQDLTVLQEQLQRLETDLANARAAEQKAQRQLQTQRDYYQSELEQLREYIQILQKRQLDSVPTSVVADLQAQLESALQQVQQLQSERDKLRLEVQLLQGIPQSTTPAPPEISAPTELTEEHAGGTESLELIRLQAQVTNLQEQLLQASADLQSWQEGYAQLQQEYAIQMAQLQQLQTEMAMLTTANQEYKAQIAQQQEHLRQSQAQITQMAAERAEMEQRIAKLEGSLQTRQEALEQAQQQMKNMVTRLSALQEQQANLMVELQDARELLAAYRQSLESLQENLRIQQDQNRLLRASYKQQKLIAEAARAELAAFTTALGSAGERSSELRLRPNRLEGTEETPDLLLTPDEDTLSDPLLAKLTPWARHLFQNLQEAGLLDRPQIERILTTWQQSGGKLTAVIGECTGLKATTLKFFADGGYSARLSGCRSVGEFLKAADLLESEVLESLPPMDESENWGDPLVERGLLRPETVQYFRKHFLHPPGHA